MLFISFLLPLFLQFAVPTYTYTGNNEGINVEWLTYVDQTGSTPVTNITSPPEVVFYGEKIFVICEAAPISTNPGISISMSTPSAITWGIPENAPQSASTSPQMTVQIGTIVTPGVYTFTCTPNVGASAYQGMLVFSLGGSAVTIGGSQLFGGENGTNYSSSISSSIAGIPIYCVAGTSDTTVWTAGTFNGTTGTIAGWNNSSNDTGSSIACETFPAVASGISSTVTMTGSVNQYYSSVYEVLNQ